MSKAALTAFLARMGGDAALREELRGVTETDGDSLETAKLVRFAAERGYDFTVDEVRAMDFELDDTQLEGVAGGGSGQSEIPLAVAGEATDDKHKGWTDILSYDTVISYKAP